MTQPCFRQTSENYKPQNIATMLSFCLLLHFIIVDVMTLSGLPNPHCMTAIISDIYNPGEYTTITLNACNTDSDAGTSDIAPETADRGQAARANARHPQSCALAPAYCRSDPQ